MIITRGSFAKALFPQVNAWYGMAYAEKTPQYPNIFAKNTSRKAFEEDISTTGLGLAQVKEEGKSVTYDTTQQGYIDRYNHVVYGLGIIITREMIEDDQYDTIGKIKTQSLARSMRQTPEVIGANILNRAFNSSYTFGDGKELCATDHPKLMGGTWANELATAADLSEDSLEQACIDIGSYTDDRGLKIALNVEKLIIPAALEFEAGRILKSIGQPGTNYNDINVLRESGKIRQGAFVNNYLTDSDAWFLITDCPNGLKYMERRAPQFDVENDFDTDNAKYKATMRFSFGCSDKHSIFGSPGS